MPITVMDGGMGRELIRRGAAKRGGLWSARALLDAPQAVVDTHSDFIAAGARIITTNSYSCIPSYLSKVGSGDQYVDLAALSGRLARRAADSSNTDTLVAGGLPPLSESYRADLVPGDAESRPVYAALAQALEPSIDLFLCETMASARESLNAAEAALGAASKRGLPVYVSWTLNERPGTGLRSGESIAQAFSALSHLRIDGFLFNCTHPDAIEAGLEEIAEMTDRPIGGYPNRFNVPKGFTLDGEVGVVPRLAEGVQEFVDAAARFVAKGATLVGGCCGIRPADISSLARSLRSGGLR